MNELVEWIEDCRATSQNHRDGDTYPATCCVFCRFTALVDTSPDWADTARTFEYAETEEDPW